MADDKIIKDAQYRKGLGIAWFNATNSAIEMVKLEYTVNQVPVIKSKSKVKGKKKLVESTWVLSAPIEDRLEYWRNHFLEKHKNYYAEVIAQVGTNYDSKESIKKLQAAKTIEELQNVWRLLSEDERHDGDIRKVAQELKLKFNESK